MAVVFQFTVPEGETWVYCTNDEQMQTKPLMETKKLYMDDEYISRDRDITDWDKDDWESSFSDYVIDKIETDCCGPYDCDMDHPYETLVAGAVYYECSACGDKFANREDAEGCC